MHYPILNELRPPPEGKVGWPWTEASRPLPASAPEGSAWPPISIITPSFNQGQFIEETIRSVLLQGYPNLEYFVIDGGSTDQTLDVIRKYEPWLGHWVSEPDFGQSHAINKGLAHATGDLVAYINSDDLYLPGAFTAVAEHFITRPTCSWICGDVIFFGGGQPTMSPKTVLPSAPAAWLARQHFAPQPGMFWRRELLRDGFDERFRYCFDFELFLRLLFSGHKCEHLPLALASFRLHETSKTIAEAEQFEDEVLRMSREYFEHVAWAAKRACFATHHFRKSYEASLAGDLRDSARHLARAVWNQPRAVLNRSFWGCLRQLLRHGSSKLPETRP
jgi:glycosyltransferase involved in cell wall biosynthesis